MEIYRNYRKYRRYEVKKIIDYIAEELSEMFAKSHELADEIRRKLGAIGYEI